MARSLQKDIYNIRDIKTKKSISVYKKDILTNINILTDVYTPNLNNTLCIFQTKKIVSPERQVFQHWNQNKIKVHRKFEKHKKAIATALKDYTVAELKEAISNYAKILASDKHYITYKFTLDKFLHTNGEMSIDCFLNINDPINNFLTTHAKQLADAVMREQYERNNRGFVI